MKWRTPPGIRAGAPPLLMTPGTMLKTPAMPGAKETNAPNRLLKPLRQQMLDVVFLRKRINVGFRFRNPGADALDESRQEGHFLFAVVNVAQQGGQHSR